MKLLHEWEKQAACQSNQDWDWFSDDETEQRIAASVCKTCPVQKDCAKFALDSQMIFGVWGGMIETELRALVGLNENGESHCPAKHGWCPVCGYETPLERPPMKEREKVKRNYIYVRCTNPECGLGWARAESEAWKQWRTPSYRLTN